MASAILVSTLSIAFRTPFPRYLSFSPSRSSQASCSPVLAPLGTIARPTAPPANSTSTSTVGLPRESRTCRARTSEMIVRDMRNSRLKQSSAARMERWRNGVLEYWSTGVLEYWSTGVLEYWSTGVLEYWSTGVLEYWSTGVL